MKIKKGDFIKLISDECVCDICIEASEGFHKVEDIRESEDAADAYVFVVKLKDGGTYPLMSYWEYKVKNQKLENK